MQSLARLDLDNCDILTTMRNHIFSIDEYYHLYNRGTDKRVIFNDHQDRTRFQALLYLCNSNENVHMINISNGSVKDPYLVEKDQSLVAIGAYVLMSNHFHILVKEQSEGGVSRFMQKLLTAYTMYFNQKYERGGALFQGRFKSRHVADNVYLKYLYAYIHMNPCKTLSPSWKTTLPQSGALLKYLNEYAYSSMFDFIDPNSRPEYKILHTGAFPNYFTKPTSHKKFIEEWLAIKDFIEVQPR